MRIDAYVRRLEDTVNSRHADPRKIASMLELLNRKLSESPKGAEAIKLLEHKIIRHAVRTKQHEHIDLRGRMPRKQDKLQTV